MKKFEWKGHIFNTDSSGHIWYCPRKIGVDSAVSCIDCPWTGYMLGHCELRSDILDKEYHKRRVLKEILR